jgi:predicted PurR-regulated permease PerM
MNGNETSERSHTPTIAFLLALGLVMTLVFQMVAPYLLAILMGEILALVAQSPYKGLMKRGFGRYQAGTIVAVAMMFTVIAPLIAFTFVAGKQALHFAQWVAQADHTQILASFDQIIRSAPFQFVLGDGNDPMQMLREQMSEIGTAASMFIIKVAKSTPETLLQLFLASFAGFYLLVDRERIQKWLAEKLPFDRQFRNQISATFRNTAISVVLASMAAAAVQAALMTAGFAALQIPGAFLAGGATFIFAWIPLVGSFPVLLVGLAYLAINGLYLKLGILLIVGTICGVADNFVRPIVLGGRGEMHPFVSLVAIFGGINLFGIFGVFVGPILAAILITLLQVWPIVGRRAGLKFDS